MVKLIPMGRFGQPSEIAERGGVPRGPDDASYFTGELIHPDGGFFTD